MKYSLRSLMIVVTLVAVLLGAVVSATVCSLVGCSEEKSYTTTTMEGVLILFRTPAVADITGFTDYVSDEAGNPAGICHLHTATDSAGVKKECIVRIFDSQLTVNGKGYGPIVKGVTVTIDGDAVMVNGAARVASDDENDLSTRAGRRAELEAMENKLALLRKLYTASAPAPNPPNP